MNGLIVDLFAGGGRIPPPSPAKIVRMERAVSGRRVTRSATKKKKPGGGPGSGTCR